MMPSSDNLHGSTQSTSVRGVKRIQLVSRRDHRGPLAVLGQDEAPMPFIPQRFFFTYEANEHSRGAHAHRVCEQLLICTYGSLKVRVSDGVTEAVLDLSGPQNAIYIGPMVWAEQFGHTPGAVLMVMASHPYDEADYIRNHADWLAELNA